MTAPRIAGKLGRTPNRGRDRIRLTSDHKPTGYTPPETLDRYSAVPVATWSMDGNDNIGDCAVADPDHETKSVEVAAGNPEVSSTTDEVIAAYSAITGYDPADPSTDQGAEMQAVRNYWRKEGITLGGRLHKILLFAEVDHTDLDLVKWALDTFGAVGIGVDFPDSAREQFDAGEPWTVVKGAQSEGGHAVAFVGYDQDYAYVLTWGKVQKVAWNWWKKYVEEVWGAFTAEFVNEAAGASPLGETLYQLGSDFERLTRQPNPIPAPTPSPSPVPTPDPAPTPTPPVADDADRSLADAIRDWLGEHHFRDNRRVADALREWMAAKGLE